MHHLCSTALTSCAEQLETEHKGPFFCPKRQLFLTPERKGTSGSSRARMLSAGRGKPSRAGLSRLLAASPGQPDASCTLAPQQRLGSPGVFGVFRGAAVSNSRGSSGRGRGADGAWQEQPWGRREAGGRLAGVSAGTR